MDDGKNVFDVGAEALAVGGIFVENRLALERRDVIELLEDGILDLAEDEG